jgi:transcriptional regulator with XRE-family HTH domain
LAAGLTQQEAADKMGRTASALAKWECGANSPTIPDIYKLAEVYGVRPSEFFVDESLPVIEAGRMRIVIDENVLSNLAAADRKRIVGYLHECSKIFPKVPRPFAEYWLEGLKAASHKRSGRSKLSATEPPSSGRSHEAASASRKTGISRAVESARKR